MRSYGIYKPRYQRATKATIVKAILLIENLNTRTILEEDDE